jgi:16S rRNA (guanine966-N2)-methyltransferase
VLGQRAQTVVERLSEDGESFDLVFADPPYPLGEDELARLLAALEGLLDGLSALLVVERSVRSPQPRLPEGLEVYRERTYGETRMWLLQHIDRDGAVTQEGTAD